MQKLSCLLSRLGFSLSHVLIWSLGCLHDNTNNFYDFLYLILTKHKINYNKIYILSISLAFIDIIILFLKYIYYKQLKIDIDIFLRSLYPIATITH